MMAQKEEHVEEWTMLGSEKPELINARSESDLVRAGVDVFRVLMIFCQSSSDEAPSAALGVSVYFSNVEENLELLKVLRARCPKTQFSHFAQIRESNSTQNMLSLCP
jgi:hypothetical protein